MLIKLLSILLVSHVAVDCAKLRKVPKVYNALITTDEQLTPSKAYPLVQPVFQPIPLFSPLYPISYADNHVPNSNARETAERKEFQNVEETNPQEVNNAEESKPEKPHDSKSSIPLNEFGFPPSLVPLKNYPAYPYNVPFFYDSFGNYQAIQYPVLPPFNVYNQQQDHNLPPLDSQPMFEVKPGVKKIPEEKSAPPQSPLSTDSIKNYSNKNVEIPDVEIPPLPVKYRR